MSLSRRLLKYALLLAAASMGAAAAALLPGLQDRQSPNLRAAGAPPIISVEAAQREVPFTIRVPRFLPAGCRLDGVRVGQIVQRNREEVQARKRANAKPIHAYGIVLSFGIDDNEIFVRGLPGSPAERAGLGGELGVQVVEANGYRPRTAEYEAEQAGLLGHRVNDPARRAAARKNPPLLYCMAREPLRLTVKDPDGKLRTVVIPGRETWTFRPEESKVNAAGNRAYLLFTMHDSRFVLHESRTVAGVRPAISPGAQPIVVRGTEVWLLGVPRAPTAIWQHDGVDFMLDNPQLALSRQEILSMIESLLGPQSGTGQERPRSSVAVPPSAPGRAGASSSGVGGGKPSGTRSSRRLLSLGL
jgi:hypothetical protein